MDDEPLYEAREKLLGKKTEIYQLYEQDSLLSKGNKRNSVMYLDEFFDVLESDVAFDRRMLQNCR